MTHQNLINVLRECPESPVFTDTEFWTEPEYARDMVISLIDRVKNNAQPLIQEANPSKEFSLASNAPSGDDIDRANLSGFEDAARLWPADAQPQPQINQLIGA